MLSVLVSFIRLLIKDTIKLFFQDCWMSHNRTSDGQLQPDPTRFPNGMKALGDYVSMLLLAYSFNAFLVSPRFYLDQSWSYMIHGQLTVVECWLNIG